jgi:hypothetical protein
MRVLLACSTAAFVTAATAQEPDPPRPVNHLANETSPYLLQHRHNPVDWYPWGEAALARARELDRPIFLSIGYAACHWCHVMERESFENPAIAALMNEYFVCIKVDREERPDLDEIYMAATQAMTGHGGWPMSVWMTPQLEPFYTGTYFPPEDRHGMPGFPRVLEHVHKLWTERRELVAEQSGRVVEYLRKSLAPVAAPDDPKPESLVKFAAHSASRYDSDYGGFGAPGGFAPKFPHASELLLLLRHHVRTGDARSLQIAEHTLEAMADGGIHDQLGGGFHRYSVDRRWLVPHFEKMLYDNSLLAHCHAAAFRATGKQRHAEVLRDTLDWMLREMQDEAGGFWSTQDADSEGVEGKFFVWSKAEFDRLLGDDAELACAHWGVTADGNWEGHNILHVARPLAEVAGKLGIAAADAERRIRAARQKLFAERSRRVRPGTDDKVLTAWNGMAIAACSVGYQTLGDARYLDAARRAATFVLGELRVGGRLLRSWRRGEAKLAGYLEDYGFLADGLLTLYESDFDPRWLREAVALCHAMREHFRDDVDGSFFFTADDHEALIARTKSIHESSMPSGIAMAVSAFLRAGLATGSAALHDIGWSALRAHHEAIEGYPLACPSLMLAVDFALADPREIVVAGPPDDARTRDLVAAVRSRFPPDHVVLLLHADSEAALREIAGPLVEGKTPVDGAPAAYVCRRGVCEAPVRDPAALR